MASLRLVSLGAVTDGVTYFSLKTDDLFSHCPLQSDLFLAVVSLLLTTTTFRRRLSRCSGVLSKFSHIQPHKINLIRVSPPDGVRAPPLLTPLKWPFKGIVCAGSQDMQKPRVTTIDKDLNLIIIIIIITTLFQSQSNRYEGQQVHIIYTEPVLARRP